MKKINEVIENKFLYPERVLQFGEGNFLRAFADWMIDMANEEGVYEGSIVLCQPIAQGLGELLNAQDCDYTHVMRGLENGQKTEIVRPITSVSRCINPYEDYEALLAMARSADLEVVISNTTEAGIAYHEGDTLADRPASSFPAKVCAFLYERYKHFNGAEDKGLLFLPVELIDNNGANLRRIVLQYAAEWQLEPAFIRWVETCNEFTSTLVDRIVTGYPRTEAEALEERFGYKDNAIVTSEIFNLWVIEGDEAWADKLPIHKTSANVIWTKDVKPYKKRKVRILNGGHTASVLAAYLAGHEIVLDMMGDPVFEGFLNKVLFEEVIPTIDLPKQELEDFANAVKDRFNNPFIKHKLLDISLNSCSKWCARCMPSLLDSAKATGKLPMGLAFSLAAFIKFYDVQNTEAGWVGHRADGSEYPVKDDAAVLEFMAAAWAKATPAETANAVLSNTAFWNGTDLTGVPQLEQTVATLLGRLATEDIRTVMQSL